MRPSRLLPVLLLLLPAPLRAAAQTQVDAGGAAGAARGPVGVAPILSPVPLAAPLTAATAAPLSAAAPAASLSAAAPAASLSAAPPAAPPLPTSPLAPPPAPAETAAARRYIRGIAGSVRLNDDQTDTLLEHFFDERRLAPDSPLALSLRREIVPAKVATEERALADLSAPFRPYGAVMLTLASDLKKTPAEIEAALTRRRFLDDAAGLEPDIFRKQALRALERDELERIVARYPHTVPGDFLRTLSNVMGASAGKSDEEVARDGVFAYVDFHGLTVRRASPGRDPDVRSADAVFYVTRENGRWRLGVYRQNDRSTRRKDVELENALRRWLSSGGVPPDELE